MSQLTFNILTKEKNDNIGKLLEAHISTVQRKNNNSKKNNFATPWNEKLEKEGGTIELKNNSQYYDME